jgi:hypothetical protein
MNWNRVSQYHPPLDTIILLADPDNYGKFLIKCAVLNPSDKSYNIYICRIWIASIEDLNPNAFWCEIEVPNVS